MAVNLTEGAITMISSGKWQSSDVQPVVQVFDCRTVSNNSSAGDKSERYRLVLSDGTFHQPGMLASQKNELVRSHQLQKGSIIQLTEYTCSSIRDRLILIVVNLDVIVGNADIIGVPQQYPMKGGSEPLLSRSPSPMQPFNQPTNMVNPQPFTTSVPQPINSPIYPPQQSHNPGLHSYGNPISHNSISPMPRTPTNTYTRPIQPTYNQPPPPPIYTNRGPNAKNDPPARIIPIAALNPYQGRWTIKARVTSKAELRNYTNAKGNGKVFSFDLLDSDKGEIRVTCFNSVAEQFYDQIEVGKVYFISKGSIKPASKAFNHLKNDHEITLDNSSTIQPCLDDDNSIPPQQFHFRPISDIESLDNNSVLDIIGIVSSITPTSSVQRKNGTETVKRTLQLKDMSGRSVEVTLWGNFCSNEGQRLQILCDSGNLPVLAVKSARVNDFNGKSVGTISTSQLIIEPDSVEGQKVRTWFESIGKNTPAVSLSGGIISKTDVRKFISQIKDEKLGTGEKADWITVSATIMQLRVENLFYTACPLMIGERQCSKKVTKDIDDKWRCDRCDQSVDQCDYRYILSARIEDHTGFIWVTAFQEGGEEITGCSAKELNHMKDVQKDEERFAEIIRNVLHSRFNFKLKVKEETYNDDPRVKSTVVKAEKVKASSDTSFYLDLLKKDGDLVTGVTVTVPKVESVIPGYGGIRDSGGFSEVSERGSFGNQYGGSVRIGSNSCSSCGGVGHSSVNCPSAYSQGGVGHNSVSTFPSAYGGGGTTDECYKCHKTGHWANNCPGTSSGSGECYKCHQIGHWARDCPGVSNGGGNVGQGRYGSQYVGGY